MIPTIIYMTPRPYDARDSPSDERRRTVMTGARKSITEVETGGNELFTKVLLDTIRKEEKRI